MVSTTAIVFMIITLLLSVLVPVIFLILLLVKGGKELFLPWLFGALGFFVPQIIIRIPALQILGEISAVKDFIGEYPIIYFLILALTAALFETAGRVIVFKLLLRKNISYKTSLAAGAGHGGIESIMLVGMTYINNLIYSILINTGLISMLIKDPSVLNTLTGALTGTPNELFLMAGFERIFTIVFHICLSLLIALFVSKGRTVSGAVLVVLLHAAIDFTVVFMQYKNISFFLIEGLLLLVAAASLVIVISIRKAFENKEPVSANGRI